MKRVLIGVLLFMSFRHVEAQQIQVSFPASYFDDLGTNYLNYFKKPFEEEVAKEGGPHGLGDWNFVKFVGIRGTRKPAGKVAYFGTSSYSNGIALYFAVKVRVKVDWGGGPIIGTHYAGSAETQQVFMFSLLPTVQDGKPRIVVAVQKVSDFGYRDEADEEDLDQMKTKVTKAVMTHANTQVTNLQDFLDKKLASLNEQFKGLPGAKNKLPKTLVITWPPQDESLTAIIRRSGEIEFSNRAMLGWYIASGIADSIRMPKVLQNFRPSIKPKGGYYEDEIAKKPHLLLNLNYNFDKTLLKHIQKMPLSGDVVVSVK